MPNSDEKDLDPLADLDDDLGDDWESAFQSEDFMFTPEEEANDFFLFDENDPEDEVDELTSIMENAEKEAKQDKENAKEESASDAPPQTDTPSTSSTAIPVLIRQYISMAISFFKQLPLYQRAIGTAVPCLILLIIFASLFLRQTSEELAETEEPTITVADLEIGPKDEPQSIVKIAQAKKEPLPALPPPPLVVKEPEPRARTIRKQWDFPTFTIVSSIPNTETLFVTVNLSLIAILPEGGRLPEEKNVQIKDIIYQFYTNRSPTELKHFALARGEMIHKLHNWLQKEWPDSPVNTVIFSRYQVVRAPQAS